MRKFDDIILKDISTIVFDDFFVEATFQLMLAMRLASHNFTVLPEYNIKRLGINNSFKKELDLHIETSKDYKIAIEMKMPMNGQTPEQMFKFCEDIKFLEEIQHKYEECYFIAVTKDKTFWSGRKQDGIYKSFRNQDCLLKGDILKPTGINKGHMITLKNEYKLNWKDLDKDYKALIIKIK